MKYLMRKKMNKKGFSLIELIVVIAILAIIAAIAIPRFALIQARSEVKSDAATAAEIVNSARIWHSDTSADNTGGEALTITTLETSNYLPANTTTQSTDVGFVLDYDSVNGVYFVTWTPTNSYQTTPALQGVIESVKYELFAADFAIATFFSSVD